MHVLTLILFPGFLLVFLLEVIDSILSESLRPIAFRGGRLVRSQRMPCHLSGVSPPRVEKFKTELCLCRVESPRVILFRAHTAFLRASWPFRGRIVADGSTWLIEARLSFLFVAQIAYVLVFWTVITWSSFALDGPAAGIAALVFAGLFLLVYWWWYRNQLRRVDELVSDIVETLQLNAGLGWSQAA